MRGCCCEGNKALKELNHMRGVALKAAKMDECVYILYKQGDIYKFCREDEKYNGIFIEYVLP